MADGIVELTGMIIKTMPVGERDRRITLLTKERGKIAFFAHGARKPGNSFMGMTRIFSFGTFRLYEGRDSYNLQSAEILNYFDEIEKDMEKTCYAAYFSELADYYSHEYDGEPEMLKLLYLSLLALSKPSIPHELTRRIFELKIMVIDGAYDTSPKGKAGDTCRFAWNFICTTPVEKLFTFALTEEAMQELSQNVDLSLKKFVDRPMHSLEILKSMI